MRRNGDLSEGAALISRYRILRPSDGEARLIEERREILRDAEGRALRVIGSQRDVTDTVAAEAKLRSARERLQLALEAGRMGVFGWDFADDVLEWDAQLYALFGVDPADGPMTGDRALGLVHPDDVASLRARISAVVEAGSGVFDYEFRVIHPDGAVRWLAGHGRVMPGQDGRAERMVGLNFDVTAAREAEAAVKRSSEAARVAAERVQLALAAGAIVGTWDWDLPADRFTVDERFAESFGIDPALGRDGLSLAQVIATVHPDDVPGLHAAIEQAMAAGGRYSHEYRVRGRDGAYRWIEANGHVDLAEDGTPRRFPGVLLDVDRRRALEAERDRATSLLRAFADAVPGVVYAKDREGRMLVSNRGTTALIGKPPEFYLGKTDAEFLDDRAQAEVIMANDRRVMDSGVAEQVEEQVSLPDGRPAVWLSTKAPFRDAEGDIVGLIGASVDITLRKEAEDVLARDRDALERLVGERTRHLQETQARLAHAQRMEALGRLAGGIAHDFNNVLQTVQSASMLVGRRASDTELVQRLARMTLDAVERGSAITRRLLAFARRDALTAEPVHAAALLDGLREMLGHTLGGHIAIGLAVEPGLPPLLADRGQLETVLVNLATNARDAMPSGGSIMLRASLERVAAGTEATANDGSRAAPMLEPGLYVRLDVVDEGSGMDAATLSRVSEPFFTTKPVGHGTGLGLSMARGFAEQSGGQLAIHSVLGRGTTVQLWLPASGPDAEAGARPHDDGAHHATGERGKHVVLVDDDAIVRETVRLQLIEAGYVVHAVEGAESAMQWLEEGRAADVLVTDLSMPGVDGLALIRSAQLRDPALPAILLTGYPGRLVEDGSGQGARKQEARFTLVRKPASSEALVRAIEALA